MKFRRRNSEALADLVCGNLGSYDPTPGEEPKYFPYRSSSYITEFFQELETEWTHDGSTRHRWVADVLDSMLWVQRFTPMLIDAARPCQALSNHEHPTTVGLSQVNQLGSGTHSLTAVFAPTDPAAFGSSTSTPVPLTVNPLLSRVPPR